MEDDTSKEWKETGSLLWIHGKRAFHFLCRLRLRRSDVPLTRSGLWEEYPMVRCISNHPSLLINLRLSSSSAIINDITTLCEAGSALMAYFYFDFREVDKQSRRNLLSSLLIQLSARSDALCDILSRLYEAHDHGMRQPSDSALTKCLKEMLTLPNQGPVYLIMDALDECPDTSDVPSAREQVLDLIKDLVSLRHPSLHICVTSRPEVDIGAALESLTSQRVSLQDEPGQKQDIATYVRSVVYSSSGKFMMKWRREDKEHVIETLSQRADGM